MCTILGFCSRGAKEEVCEDMLLKCASRGPDMTRVQRVEEGILGFGRLSIMGLTDKGMQPFNHKGNTLVCNGEIYGFRKLKDYLTGIGYSFESDSDCEILLPLYDRLGTAMFSLLDAEFALIIYDHRKRTFIAARDPIGIRPLYYGYDKNGHIVFASEPKMLVDVCDKIRPFPPGYYYEYGKLIR